MKVRSWLKKNYPLKNPVKISRVDRKNFLIDHGSDCFGDHSFNGHTHSIRLNKTLKDYEINSTMCHEWTHAIIAELPDYLSKGPHDELFALIHTRILNHWLDQN